MAHIDPGTPDDSYPACLRCGARLVRREGRHGPFAACPASHPGDNHGTVSIAAPVEHRSAAGLASIAGFKHYTRSFRDEIDAAAMSMGLTVATEDEKFLLGEYGLPGSPSPAWQNDDHWPSLGDPDDRDSLYLPDIY